MGLWYLHVKRFTEVLESIWLQGENGLLLSAALQDGYAECPAWAGNTSTDEGHSLPCRISSGSRSGRSCSSSHCAVVPVQQFRARCQHWPCVTCPATSSVPGCVFPTSFPFLTRCQGEELGSSWGVCSCLGLLLSHASVNLRKLQKLRAGITVVSQL